MPQEGDLRYFGHVSASVSHELKNVLAVINEQAGLLGDLARMAARGMPLDPERLAAAADCLLRQVRRGDALLSHFNRFAHTPDTPEGSISLPQAVALAVALGERQAGMRQTTLTALPGADIAVSADPFALCRLLDWCLARALEHPGPQKALTLEPRADAEGPALVVTGLDPAALPGDDGVGEELAKRLGARLVLQPGSIRVLWPAA